MIFKSKNFPPSNIGKRGEQIALSYLKKKGMKLLHKNLRFKLGEIDLLMLDGEQHVIVEVKTRTRSGELLFENIDARKRRKLTSLANCYQVFYKRKNGITPKCRIDAVGVLLSSNQKKSTAQIEHLRSVL